MHNLIGKLHAIEQTINSSFSNLFPFEGNSKFYPSKPKSTDIQIVAMSLLMEMLSIHSERYFYFLISECNPRFIGGLPVLCNFNRRRKSLMLLIDEVARHFSEEMIGPDSTFLIDSTPVEVCRFVRFSKLKILKECDDFRPKVSRNFIDKRYYAGYKLHAVVSSKGVIVNYELSQANVHDVSLLQPLAEGLPVHYQLIGDRGYISESKQLELFHSNQVKVYTPSRSNQKPTPFPITKHKQRIRKRIETCFSQLKDQYRLASNYAKSFCGLLTRVVSKIAAFTVAQYFNFLLNKPIGKVKYAF